VDKRLRIILELVTGGFANGARGAGSIFKGFISSIVGGAKSAGQGLLSLAQNVFFLREALSTLANVARWVFDTFVKGAGDDAKLEARLKALTGSAEAAAQIMEKLDDTAAATGISVSQLSDASISLAVAAKDASGNFDIERFDKLLNLVTRFSTLKPDIPMQSLAKALADYMETGDVALLARVLDVPKETLEQMGIVSDAIQEASGDISRGVTSIEGGVAKGAQDATANLEKLEELANRIGATQGLLGDISEKSGLERFQQILDKVFDTIGEPIFEAFNDELSRLADWLEANPEKVDAFAKSLGDLATKGLQEVFKILENVDWENLATNISSLVQSLSEGDWESAKKTLEGIAAAFQAIADAIQTIRDLLTTLDQLKKMGEMGVSVLGPESRVGELTALEKASLANQPTGNGGAAPQRVVVDINLKSDMLDAQIRQGADGAVTSALNAAAEEFHRGGH
jgi:hypothetical protein